MTKEQELLVLDNLNLVNYTVYQYSHIFGANSSHDFDDKLQIGKLGLIKAAKTFTPDKKTKFSTYAYICIRNELISAAEEDVRKNGLTFATEDLSVANMNFDNTMMEADVDYQNLCSILEEIKKPLAKTLQLGIDALILTSLKYTMNDIADILKVPRTHIYTCLHRAREVVMQDKRFKAYIARGAETK